MARRLSLGKLTPTQVRRIRELKKSGLTCKEIAERFPVKEESIRRICNRETWDHVE
jgi:orotate phosphoribosyltransferase-like protein